MFETTSRIELSKSALKNNITFLKNLFGLNVRFSSVVKGNAYGHGIEQFVPIAEESGINHFSVFSCDEALRVYNSSSHKSQIMIMGGLIDTEIEWAIEKEISFWVFEVVILQKALAFSKKSKRKARIHLEVETGMNRTGITNKSLKEVITLLKEHSDHFIFEGLCTHYAGAESVANHVRVNRQIKKFNRIYEQFKNSGLEPRSRHTACSAAALNYPKTRMDMVRIGIAQYGFWPSVECFIKYLHGRKDRQDPLNRVIAWKSRIISIKKVNEGEFISYGTTYIAREKQIIAIIPVGYAHGYSRSLSNQGRILIGGQRVGVIGMINMNMLIADVTSIPFIQIGDEVVIIGKQKEMEISVASFSEIVKQINYELLVRLPERTTRVVVD